MTSIEGGTEVRASAPRSAIVGLTHVRKRAAARLRGSVDPVAEPLASPTIHDEREQLVEDVVVEPAAAGGLVPAVVDQRAFDLEKASGREWPRQIED